MESIDIFSWYIVKAVLSAGPFGVAAFLAVLTAAAFCAGYSMRSKRADKPMGNVKMDHIKYDILPDGTLGPGDNRNLEGPE
jgi:hypothetical protein